VIPFLDFWPNRGYCLVLLYCIFLSPTTDSFAIVGYARIILAIISFYFMPTDYVTASWCYIISALLDALDGHAARYLGQSKSYYKYNPSIVTSCC